MLETEPHTGPMDDTVAVVTGASSGIGAAVVSRLLEAGGTVVATDCKAPGKHAEHGVSSRLHIVQHDVTVIDSWNAVRDYVHEHAGRISLLVNNAGTSARCDMLSTSDSDWDRIFQTNLWSCWAGIRVFVDDLAAHSGSVVNVGSVYGARVPPSEPSAPVSVAYQVSKAGVHMLTRTAASELASLDIRVNAVLPGVIETDMVRDLQPAQLQQRIEKAPMQRPGSPTDIADAVCYLATARFVTGSLLTVDGGLTST